ncbi:PAS domain-containing protein [Actinospica sp.]|uniref:PAS domain-containing protein n=1 Tax=Actinospica sp. TaxID=1872142 RepID=UPI002B512402|nr:PAS domain-containing protein [Actinospica sp.]HWG25516.1 PAS domain-containing protein [Actinospica sp.]
MGPTNRTPVRGAARLAAILDALPDALLLVDASGAVVNANTAALTLFEGESAERLLGKAIAELLPGFGRTVATPGAGPAALPAGSAPLDPRDLVGAAVRRPPERMAARRTDGSVFPAEVTTAELTEEDESELTLLVVRDLTGVLDVEAELRRQQRQIELILRAASEGIIGVDHEGRIVLVNPAGAKILRYRAADLGGQNVHELLTHSRADGTPLPESECPLLDSVRTGAKHRAVDCVLWRSDGGPVYVDLTTAPVYEGENIIGAVMTFVDNSATRSSARQAAELTNVLDKDLRGSLVDVAARLREILEYAESEYAASGYGSATLPMLEEVGADVEQLTTLAADVVDFQQSVLGSLEYEPELVQLGDVVVAAVDAAAPVAAASGVEIAAHCAEVEVDLDAELFVKLLIHLLADMVAVSPVGGKIVVTAARRGALARIEIRGPHTGGGPLHLPIAQAIASRHGGTVTTHRIAGKGNTHVIEVPVTQPNRPDRPAKPDQPKTAEGPVRSALPTRVRGASRTAIGSTGARPAAVGSAARAAIAEAAPAAVANDAEAEQEQEQPETNEAAAVPEANGRQPVQPPRRRRAAPPQDTDLQARIPAQSRSSLTRSIADLRPTRPMPTGDVWSKPDRSLTSEPAPAELAQSDTQWIVPLREDQLEQSSGSLETSAPTTPEPVKPVVQPTPPAAPEPVRYAPPWQPAAESQEPDEPEPDATQRMPMPEQMQPPSYVAATHSGQPRGRRRGAQSDADLGESSPSLPQVTVPTPVPPPFAAAAPRPAEPARQPAQQPELPPARRTYALPAAAETKPEPQPEPESEPESAAPKLLLWPDPDRDTSALLRERGYDPVSLGQPDQLPTLTANGTGAPHPFAVFVDPISAPITRRGLREVRAAATKAGLPLLVTAGIGRSPDGHDLGPDPSLLLTALCPSDVRLPRVLLVEARPDLADAMTDILERQGMQVAHATTDAESRESAVASPPDLVLLDLMQIRRRRVGVVDWLRDRGLLSRTPLVVYTAEGSDAGGLETLYLTERATDVEPANRIGDLLAKIAPL